MTNQNDMVASRLATPERAQLHPTAARVCGVLMSLVLLFGAAPLSAATVSVPGNYATIQTAINAVLNGSLANGSVIQVQPGTYSEALVVGANAKSFTVQGVGGAGSTIINATGKNTQALRMTSSTGTVNFYGLTFTGGVGTTWAGGIWLMSSSPHFVGCVIQGNRALDGGGVVLTTSSPTFDSSFIQNNTATRFGGGLVITQGSKPVFTSSFIRNNTAGTNSSIGSGGGIHINDASPTFLNTSITGNQAKFAGGGIIMIGLYGSAYGVSTLTLKDSDVSGNTASRWNSGMPPAEGGGINVEDNSITYVTRTSVRNNVAGTGGGLNAYRARFDVLDSIIENNQATDPQNVGGFGGGVSATSNNVSGTIRSPAVINLTQTTVRNNSARISGGVFVTGDQICSGGGCSATTTPKATLNITDSIIDNNSASLQAGAIRTDRARITVTRSHIIRNRILPGSGSAFGAGILMAQSTIGTFTNATIAANTGASVGGGLFVDNGTSVSVTASNIYKNAGSIGGGLYVGNVAPVPTGTIQSSVIADNSNFQIYEQACGTAVPILTYLNNTIVNQGSTQNIYQSTCSPGAVTNMSTFNNLPSPSGNNSNTPGFVDFMAAPKVGTSVLSWVVARASSVNITPTVGTISGDYGTRDVTPSAPTTYTLTPSIPNALVTTASVTVQGPAGSAPPPPPPPDDPPPTSGFVVLGTTTDIPVPADFDGDGKTDPAVFGKTTALWKYRRSSDGVVVSAQFGAPSLGDMPVPADYDGDGKADIAIFRKSNGQWFVRRSSDQGITQITWGVANADTPAPADYDGDGKADFAVFRSPSGQWLIKRSSDGGTTSQQWGAPSLGDKPVVADYDGDHKADIAIYRGSTGQWFVQRSSNLGLSSATWGQPAMGDAPTPADFDGDGKADFAFYRKSSGQWQISNSGGGVTVTVWGISTDLPVPAPYAGGAATKIGVWRASDGTWRW